MWNLVCFYCCSRSMSVLYLWMTNESLLASLMAKLWVIFNSRCSYSREHHRTPLNINMGFRSLLYCRSANEYAKWGLLRKFWFYPSLPTSLHFVLYTIAYQRYEYIGSCDLYPSAEWFTYQAQNNYANIYNILDKFRLT